ncbi:hypothetical protein ACFVTX_07445 [Agromyces sp. NPDC058136]|uniref:hypothetical protein n=1 Tax=Agromyces sp. NPDC058136 TaxID=3346354 RepID=UPI0036D98847
MNIWMLLVGCAAIIFGVVILLNQERLLRWSQKNMRQNVGRIGETFASLGKPRDMVWPGVGAIAVGLILVARSFG